MTPEVAVDIFREALWLTTMMVAILVIPSLLVMLVTLIVGGPWIIQTFMEYIIQLYKNIPLVIG